MNLTKIGSERAPRRVLGGGIQGGVRVNSHILNRNECIEKEFLCSFNLPTNLFKLPSSSNQERGNIVLNLVFQNILS